MLSAEKGYALVLKMLLKVNASYDLKDKVNESTRLLVCNTLLNKCKPQDYFHSLVNALIKLQIYNLNSAYTLQGDSNTILFDV
jgi:hypothetical protein